MKGGRWFAAAVLILLAGGIGLAWHAVVTEREAATRSGRTAAAVEDERHGAEESSLPGSGDSSNSIADEERSPDGTGELAAGEAAFGRQEQSSAAGCPVPAREAREDGSRADSLSAGAIGNLEEVSFCGRTYRANVVIAGGNSVEGVHVVKRIAEIASGNPGDGTCDNIEQKGGVLVAETILDASDGRYYIKIPTSAYWFMVAGDRIFRDDPFTGNFAPYGNLE